MQVKSSFHGYYGGVSIAQSEEMMDRAVLGGVVEVVSSIPAVGHKIFFSIFWQSWFIISLHINLQYKSVSVSDPM